jgi:dTDP-glucose pyrophosphorylase
MEKELVGVITAAGKGTRIVDLPFTRILPKAMLPIMNKPIIEYIIDNMKNIIIKKIYIIVDPNNNFIQQYFKDGSDFGVEIKYIEQTNPEGIAHAISLVKDHVKGPFIVILGDDFTITDSLNNLVETFLEKNCLVVEGVVEDNDIQSIKRTCNVILENGKIVDIIEKPENANSNIRGCGIYIFDPKVFDYIEKTPKTPPKNEKEITNTIKLIAKDGLAHGTHINGTNININTTYDLDLVLKLVLEKNKLSN